MTDQEWLENYILQVGAVAGTVHRRESGGLRLTASRNIPPNVCEVVAWVPDGKGMAGQALITMRPVMTCNLKDDGSSAIRPGARAVDAQAAIALPLLSDGGNVEAVVGLAWPDRREFANADIETFTRLGSSLLQPA